MYGLMPEQACRIGALHGLLKQVKEGNCGPFLWCLSCNTLSVITGPRQLVRSLLQRVGHRDGVC